MNLPSAALPASNTQQLRERRTGAAALVRRLKGKYAMKAVSKAWRRYVCSAQLCGTADMRRSRGSHRALDRAVALEKLQAEKSGDCWNAYEGKASELQLKLTGVMLVQESDVHDLRESDLKVATKRAPTADEIRDLLFAWKVAKHVKSNAILFARGGQTVMWGQQMSRDRRRLQTGGGDAEAAGRERGRVGCIFPFADGVEEARLGRRAYGARYLAQDQTSMRTRWSWRWCLPVCGISGIRAVRDLQRLKPRCSRIRLCRG